MTGYHVRVQRRDFTELVIAPRLQLEPARFSWDARGGPDTAEIDVTVIGEPDLLWSLLSLLRCPLRITSDSGQVLWSGYISDVQVQVDAVSMHSSVEQMFNRIAAQYVEEDATCLPSPLSTRTAWAENAASIAEYGIKETLQDLGDTSTEVAESARDRALDTYGNPLSDQTTGKGSERRGSIIARGWWPTLGWRYYQQPTSDKAETSVTIADIIAASGQFFTGVKVRDRSDRYASEFRDGNLTGLAEILWMLDVGVLGGNRYLVDVDFNRNVLVYEEPDSDDKEWQVRVLPDGGYRHVLSNKILPPGLNLAGRWLDLAGSIPQTTSIDYVARPVPAFIERAEFTPAGKGYRLDFRGAPSPWDMPTVGTG